MDSFDTTPGASAFRRAFKGPIITAAASDYDVARSLWNGDIDRRPLAVVKAVDESDVATAIQFARGADLPLAIRAGGHSYPGHSMCDGGITIDMSNLGTAVYEPDTGLVRVGGGALLGDVDRATLRHGRVMPAGIVSHTGMPGLALGGGIGYLTRSLGLTCDQFSRVRLVTANGEIVHVSETEDTDLFWALRGGGGNFGVVTEFECRTHELGPIQAGHLVYPMSDAPNVMMKLGELMKDAPRELSITFGLGIDAHKFPGVAETVRGERVLVGSVVYRGNLEDAILQELRTAVAPVFDAVITKDFRVVQTANDEIAVRGVGWYMKSGHARELTRPLVEWLAESSIDYRDNISSPLVEREVWAVQSIGGAVQDIDEDATAYSGRAANWHIAVEVGFTTPEDRHRIVPWTRESWLKTKALLDMSTSYVNLNFEERSDALVDVFGADKFAKLQRVKTEWDPDNVFRYNFNIPPLPQVQAVQ